VADQLFVPKNFAELRDILGEVSSVGYHLLGNGSNIFVASRRIRKPVIHLGQALKHLDIDAKTGKVQAGASVDIRKMIADCTRLGLRAPVELLTIPATIGGAIFMNAGRWTLRTTISDHLSSVEVFDGTSAFRLSRNECRFGHRYSVFHERRDLTILSAEFQYDRVTVPEILLQKKASIEAGRDKCTENFRVQARCSSSVTTS